ncbi:MAG: hypothetical protein WC467_04710 [Patescibacteria group bacterium]
MKNWKASLIGRTTNNWPEGEQFKNIELHKPLSLTDSISRCVCAKCQNIFEINEEIVLGLLNTMKILGNSPEINVTKTTDFKDWYFETNYCSLCTPEKDVFIKIKKLA